MLLELHSMYVVDRVTFNSGISLKMQGYLTIVALGIFRFTFHFDHHEGVLPLGSHKCKWLFFLILTIVSSDFLKLYVLETASSSL